VKALVCRELTGIDALKVEDVAEPKPGADEVVVAVKAAGVNYPDVLLAQGKYQYKAPLPFSPGFELAGIVRSVGANVKDVRPGDRVQAIVNHGAFAQAAVVPANRIMKLPEGAEFDAAAALIFTYGTSYHALKDRAQLQAGETLLVLGAAGGVGLAAVELGKLMGAHVIAAASSAEKLDICRDWGAAETIDYTKDDLRERVKSITGGRGVDVVLDPVGGAFSEAALRSMAWKGRHLVVGFTAGDIPKIPLNLPLLKGCSIVGVYLGAFIENEPAANRENSRQLLEWLAAGKIKPHISASYPLAQGVEGLRDVQERRVMGKVVILPG
jgi:NADPH2:quinone reductase